MKKDSAKPETCTSKNDEERSTWNKSSWPYDKGNDRGEIPSDDEDHRRIGSPSRDPTTTTDPPKRDHRGPTTTTTHLP